MEIMKNTKIKRILIGCSVFILLVLISLLELYLAHRIRILYVDVYKIYSVSLVLIQPLFCVLFYREKVKHLNLKISVLILYLIMIPLITYITLPHYTYYEGKQQVTNYINSYETFEFADISPKRVAVPAENPKKFIDEIYYYVVTMNGTNRYFVVDPRYGEVHEWSVPAY